MNLVLRPAANAAFMAALVWLLQRRHFRVAGALNAAWEAALDDILAMPRRFPPVGNSPTGREFRECILIRLGYRIIFEVAGNEIRVSAFVSTRQHQNRWLDQLDAE